MIHHSDSSSSSLLCYCTNRTTHDPICCITCSRKLNVDQQSLSFKPRMDLIFIPSFLVFFFFLCIAKYLMVGRESGSVHRYILPEIKLESKYTLRYQISLSSSGSDLPIYIYSRFLPSSDISSI